MHTYLKYGAVALAIVLAFLAGRASHSTSLSANEAEEERWHARIGLYEDAARQMEARLKEAGEELEQLRSDRDRWMSAEHALAGQLEEVGGQLARYEAWALTLTDGEKVAYEVIKSGGSGGGETVVFVGDAPGDYYERGQVLIKLGVAFGEFESVSFWYDKQQAERYARGELQRNEDELLPPYAGIFGEIGKAPDDTATLSLHGSTGGPLYLVFGKYGLPRM